MQSKVSKKDFLCSFFNILFDIIIIFCYLCTGF